MTSMTRSLEGKVALVTGAARGQGRAHCLRFAQLGAAVIAFDICADVEGAEYAMASPADLEATARLVRESGGEVLTHVGDVRRLDDLEAAVAKAVGLGGLHIAVANAGIVGGLAPTPANEDRALERWKAVIDVDLTGVYLTARAAAGVMVEQAQGGSITLISSTAGFKGSDNLQSGSVAYTAAKHGVVGIMRQFALGLAPHMIRVNSIHPTGVRTDMVLNPASAAFFAANPARGNPMPIDMIEAEDVSHAVAWLASDEARYVTGVALPVDAGYNLW